MALHTAFLLSIASPYLGLLYDCPVLHHPVPDKLELLLGRCEPRDRLAVPVAPQLDARAHRGQALPQAGVKLRQARRCANHGHPRCWGWARQ